jgi:hypothetical protein
VEEEVMLRTMVTSRLFRRLALVLVAGRMRAASGAGCALGWYGPSADAATEFNAKEQEYIYGIEWPLYNDN